MNTASFSVKSFTRAFTSASLVLAASNWAFGFRQGFSLRLDRDHDVVVNNNVENESSDTSCGAVLSLDRLDVEMF